MRCIRRRFFIGCEGNGERALVTTLQHYAEEMSSAVHLEAFNAHGGAPMAILERSIKESKIRAANRGKYDGGVFVLLDQDRIDSDGCGQVIANKAKNANVKLVRQNRKLESHLGRLITGKCDLGATRAEEELLKIWPSYDRSFDAASLRAKMKLAQLQNSHASSEEWAVLLHAIGIRPAN